MSGCLDRASRKDLDFGERKKRDLKSLSKLEVRINSRQSSLRIVDLMDA